MGPPEIVSGERWEVEDVHDRWAYFDSESKGII
jgi:hypothetical protein